MFAHILHFIQIVEFCSEVFIFSPTIFLLEFCQNVEFLSLLESKENTVPAGFCDQPPSGGVEVAKSSAAAKASVHIESITE